MLQKITAFLLLIALTVNLMGYYVIFQCNQLVLRYEMAALIRAGAYTSKFENIKISKNATGRALEFSNDDEFYYQGILYDLIARSSTKDTETYICIQDKNEQSLISNFTQFLRQNSDLKDTKKSKPILALIQQLINQALIQKTLSPKTFLEKDFIFPVMICRITPVFLPCFSPPPETC